MSADRWTEQEQETEVPAELLRAGVYVPAAGRSLEEAVEEVVARSSAGPDRAGELLSRLAAEPALLDEAVRRLGADLELRAIDSLLPLRPGDLLITAALARECGLPVRGLDARPAGDAFAATVRAGERILAVTAVHEREIWERTRTFIRRAGGDAAGCVCLAAPDGKDTDEVWDPLARRR